MLVLDRFTTYLLGKCVLQKTFRAVIVQKNLHIALRKIYYTVGID